MPKPAFPESPHSTQGVLAPARLLEQLLLLQIAWLLVSLSLPTLQGIPLSIPRVLSYLRQVSHRLTQVFALRANDSLGPPHCSLGLQPLSPLPICLCSGLVSGVSLF